MRRHAGLGCGPDCAADASEQRHYCLERLGRGEHETPDQRRWHGNLLVGLSGGHYWTDHLKTEVEASWNSPQKHEVYETIERQGGYTYALSDYRAHEYESAWRSCTSSAATSGFIRTSASAPTCSPRDFTRAPAAVETVFIQNRNVPVDIPGVSERKTMVFAQAVLKTGVKMYVGEKTFFNTELKFGVRRDIDHVVWKIGMGVDF